MRNTLIAAAFTISLVTFSCSPPPTPTPDAGVFEVDAGREPTDSGVDAGAPDAGSPEDAGVEVDAGTDAGITDAGIADAGLPDAGMDAGIGVDAGCVCALPRFCNGAMQCVSDTAPPTITVIGSAGQSNSTIRVQGTAVDLETGINTVSISVNQSSAQVVPVTGGVFDAQITVSTTGRAEFNIAVTGADLAGNAASASAVFDPTAPAIVTAPADFNCGASGCTGAFINAQTSGLTVTATVTELELATTNPVRVRVVTPAGSELVASTPMTLQGATWSWTWTNFPAFDETLINFEITATDRAGNVGTAIIHGILDRSAPTILISNAGATCTATTCSGAVVNAQTSSLPISGVTTAGATVSVRVLDGAADIVPLTAVTTDPQGAWSWSWTSFPMVDGRYYRFEAVATDRLGNTATRSINVLVDRTAPGLLVVSPTPAQLVGTSTLAVTASSTDGLGVASVEVSTGSTWSPAPVNGSGDYVGSVNVPAVDAVSQTISVRATDLTGNVRTATRSYVADRVAPVVTVNGADFDCSGSQCTGMVANRSSTSVAFSGTATDGSAVTLTKTLFGTSQISTATDPVSGGAWSWTWSSLPTNVNGAAYELRLVATDAAGNASSQLVRRVWLDNVAPTVTVPVSGQRNVSRTATLLTFSEPMIVSTVLNGTSFTPSAMLTGFGTTDGRNFAFSSPVLRNYVWYRLVDSASRDLAGNDLVAMADAYFLSEPVARAATTVVRPVIPGYTYRFPVVAVDSDQQLFVHYTAITSTATVTESMLLNGTGLTSSLANTWGGTNITRSGDVRIVSETRGADQRLTPALEYTVLSSNGSIANVFYGTQTNSWSLDSISSTYLPYGVGPSVAINSGTLAQLRPTVDLRPYSSGVRRGFVFPNTGASSMTGWEVNGGFPNATNSYALTSFLKMDGRASVESTATLGQYRVRYFDLDAISEVGTFGFVRGVTGQPALKRLDTFFGVPVATSASFMAWASDTQLTIMCSPSAFSPSPVWRPTALAMPSTTTATGLTSAMNSSIVVFASEFGGSVYVHSTPVNGCAAAPVVTQVRVLPGMKEPSIFIDATGTIWIAAISSAGEVVVHKL